MKRIILFLLLCLPVLVFAQEGVGKKYPVKKGNLLFSKGDFKLSRVTTSEIRRDSIAFLNAGKTALDLSINMKSSYMKFELHPSRIEPGMSGYFVVIFNARQKGDYGNCYDGVVMNTNDPVEPEKLFFLTSHIVEDFSKMNEEELANAPILKFDREGYDFGVIRKGEKVTAEFAFINAGKSDLIFRKVKVGCTCTIANLEKNVVHPGERSKISVILDTSSLEGKENKTVFVFSNDPASSSITLSLTGEIK